MLVVWDQFVETAWLSLRKALYIELTLQLVAYLLLVVREMDWAAMLVVLAWMYLSRGDRQFMAMYLSFIVVSILFDVIHLAELPSFDRLTAGETFTTYVWIVIFAFKPIIVVTMLVDDQMDAHKKGRDLEHGRAYEEQWDVDQVAA